MSKVVKKINLDNLESAVKCRIQEALKMHARSSGSSASVDALMETLQEHGKAMKELCLGKTPKGCLVNEFLLGEVLLNETLSQSVQEILSLQAKGALPTTLSDGNILGTRKYEALDKGWLHSVAAWLEYYMHKPIFSDTPSVVPIPDETTIGLLGDWGTGDWEGSQVHSQIAKHVGRLCLDYNIHLGDVYYSGLREEQHAHMLASWPAGKRGNFALNSNHERYVANLGYFDVLLGDPRFALQRHTSFFALENRHWLIIGLDTATFAEKTNLFMEGAIDASQAAFLDQMAAKKKPIILMTHHQPLNIQGTDKEPLWDMVVPRLGKYLRYWYAGHIHIGAVYHPYSNVLPRVVGHGAVPWGHASDLMESENLLWYEKALSPSDQERVRVQNGFAVLRLDGDTLQEEIYGEEVKCHWSATQKVS